jgi:hypothetical protein
MSGEIVSNSGKIGNWNIKNSELSSDKIKLYSDNINSYIKISDNIEFNDNGYFLLKSN